jgi:hypothetical protein
MFCMMWLMIIWKKSHEKAWALLCFVFAQAVHTSSISYSQFDKHLILPKISRRHPLCVAVMSLKTIHAFCSQWPLHPWAKYNNYNSLLPECSVRRSSSHSNGSPSPDRVFLTGYKCSQTSGAQLRAFLSNSEVHIEGIGRTVHIYCSSANKMSRPNKQQKH